VWPLELAAAERLLLDANPTILQARAALAGARAGIDIAGARPNPQLTVGATSTDPGRNGSGSLLETGHRQHRAPRPARRARQQARSAPQGRRRSNLSATGADLDNTVRLARIDLANAWLDLRAAREIRRIADENAALARRAADAAELRGKAGDLAGVDVARFAADAARVANDAVQAELDLARARIALALLLGNRVAPAACRPATTGRAPPNPPPPAPKPSGPTSLAARRRVEQAERPARTGPRPAHPRRLRRRPVRTRPGQRQQRLLHHLYGLSVSVPLMFGNDYRGDIARSEADYTAAEQQLIATRAFVSSEQSPPARRIRRPPIALPSACARSCCRPPNGPAAAPTSPSRRAA
jgi:cobalt-zinc-cadmium efflux system outer membrane protein